MREVYEPELTNAPWPPATRPMSALGQKQTSRHLQPMSALPPKADIGTQSANVRYVPKADIGRTTALLSAVFLPCPPWDKDQRV